MPDKVYINRWFVSSFLILCFAIMVCPPLFAAPHLGDPFQFRQPDDSLVDVLVWGDEYYQFVETPDGYTLIRDPETNWICYAELSAEGNELVSTGIIYSGQSVIQAAPPDNPDDLYSYQKIQTLENHLRLPGNIVREKAMQQKQILDAQMIEADNALFAASPDSEFAADSITPAPLPDEVVGLTILINFPDVKSSITKSDVEDYCNKVGYTQFNNNGSVRDYYYAASYGKLTYTNLVTNYYTAKHVKYYYDNPDNGRARELIYEALDYLCQTGFDFSPLTLNDNGQVRAINFFYAGNPESGWAKGLWPHASGIGNYNANGVILNRYQMTNIGSSLQIGTFCHENGHMVCGWPDLYDYGYESSGVGNFCIMASGSHSSNPILPNPYFRGRLGWENFIDLSTVAEKVLTHTANSNTTYRYKNPNNSKEFFLIESRLRTGRNEDVPDEGLIIWHVDEDGSNDDEQMTPSKHYLVSVEQADGRFDLEHGTNGGDSSDCFDTKRNLFDESTNPNSDWWNGTASGLYIKVLSDPGPTVKFSIARKYSGGTGTELNPYRILTVNDLKELSTTFEDFNKYFILLNDLDLGGEIFTQAVIAAQGQPSFSGHFDGNGHVLRNLRILPDCDDESSHDLLGLFGVLRSGATIKNLGVDSIRIEACAGSSFVGPLVARNQGSVTSCFSSGSITMPAGGSSQIGGLVGENLAGKITSCYSICKIIVQDGSQVGGLCGYNSGSIAQCYAANTLNSMADETGGLCGFSEPGKINSSFWDVELSGLDISSGGIGLTTDQMKQIATFIEAGWNISATDFNTIWLQPIYDYPKLSWQSLFPLAVDGLPIWSARVAMGRQYEFTFEIYGVTSETQRWRVSADHCSWINAIEPASGVTTGPGDVTQVVIRIDTTGLEAGYHTCSLVISDMVNNHVIPMQIFVFDPFVDLEDFDLMVRHWNEVECDGKPCYVTDWFHDGTIDIVDLFQLAQNWLTYDMNIDCDDNGLIDEIEIQANSDLDCNGNGLLDLCEMNYGKGYDINYNGKLDTCEFPGAPVGMKFSYIPGGTFLMGNTNPSWPLAIEKPDHLVALKPFYISQNEITNYQYVQYLTEARSANLIKIVNGIVYDRKDVDRARPYFRTSLADSDSQIDYIAGKYEVTTRDNLHMGDHPVSSVSWYGAKAFCDFYGYKLPTEAQWEFSAHGGFLINRADYPWGNNTINCSLANYYGPCNPASFSQPPYTNPVGFYGPQGLFKLNDMTGNVWEWCRDWLGPYTSDQQQDPIGPENGTEKIIRGGSWGSLPVYCRVTYRDGSLPVSCSNSTGFRVIIDLEP